jgi:hypothetical protein
MMARGTCLPAVLAQSVQLTALIELLLLPSAHRLSGWAAKQ